MKLRLSRKQFRQLSFEQRITALECCGVYLMCRTSQGSNICLYGLNGYYVEVWISSTSGELTCIEDVSDDDAVENYLDKIFNVLE